MHSGGLELTKLTYTRLEDNLIRHPGYTSLERHPGYTSLEPRLSLTKLDFRGS